MHYAKTLIAAALTVSGTTAFAGSADPAPMEEPVTTPVAVPMATPNWTGFYGGAQLGYGSVDTNVSGSDDGVIGGLTAGYDYDLGDFVVGAGMDYDFTEIDVANGAADLENVFRAKLRGGYKLGQGLIYGTGGYALAETDNLGSENGYFVGAGYEHLVTEQFSVGGEVLYHEFDNVNSTTTDVDATTVQLRGTFRF